MDWHSDRPRERLWRLGPASLSDAELLALVLGTGTREQDVMALARALLAHVGGLAALASASPSDLKALPGIGRARAAEIAAIAELAVRIATKPLREQERFLSGEQIYAAYAPRLAQERRELFFAVALDAKRCIIGEHCIAAGHLTGVEVHPREMFRMLVRNAAAAAVVVHNHPSGDPTPSREDLLLTHRLWQAGWIVGIEVIDHVVVGKDRFFSMKAQGWLSFEEMANSPKEEN